MGGGGGSGDITLVLVGKVGSGKSATANSILGRNTFLSEYSYTSVTGTCQIGSVTLSDDGSAEGRRTIKVIDTPGLFDMNIATEEVRKEIVKCIDMSRDGIHAMLMVFSATTRFTCEDAEAIECIKMFFGDKIVDHMILVFTNGDQVGETIFERMLTNKDAVFLQRMVHLCGDRVILFDNKTSDVQQQQKYLKKLLHTVDCLIQRNGGKPFSNEMFTLMEVLEKLNSSLKSLQKQLLKEQKERQRSDEEIRNLVKRLDNIKWMEDTTEFFQGKKCIIM